MKKAFALACLLSFNALLIQAMPKIQDDKLKSRAELTNYEETSRYEDVMRVIGELQKRTPNLRVESFGKSEEGRDLPLLIFADPPIAQPRDARASGKTVVFVQANIHAGEVEGKEAMLHLSRRLAFGDLKTLLNSLVILIAPIYNADGNEKIAPTNRTAQNGPIGGVGTRENAKSFDLNRDYMKLETPEANALVGLFNRWDPHLIVDLHTTNGSYHGYHLTYSPMLNPNADARLIAFERNKMLPAITRTLLRQHKFRTYYYGNFATKERLNRELDNFEIQRAGREAQPSTQATDTKVWRTFDHRPMFGNNYAGLRNRMTILSEAYSYLDFKGRIAVTEAFVEEIFKYSALHAAEIAALTKRADDDAVRGKLGQQGVAFEIKALDKPVNILVGAVEKKKNPRNGKDMTAMLEDKVTPTPMLDYGLFAATKSAAVPRAYLFRNEAGLQTILAKLLAHGIAVEELTEPLTAEVESFAIEQVNKVGRAFQGHQQITLKGSAKPETLTFPAGAILVRTTQSLAPLAFYLLEAESDNGFVNWNFLDAYLEKGKTYPIYKLMKETPVVSKLK
ncbi:MAG: M14 family metallopeptidase [Acidobacteria bacterium]|nr:M14 family metallopeptidase [Acidobacteriota bacterium]MBI3422009.1 M14 family metallopeptidase [Acidobacteriota bacterium]